MCRVLKNLSSILKSARVLLHQHNTVLVVFNKLSLGRLGIPRIALLVAATKSSRPIKTAPGPSSAFLLLAPNCPGANLGS